MKIAIIGCGNMARALLTKVSCYSSEDQFYTYSPSGLSAKTLAQKINGTQVDSLAKLVDCDFFLIACKPQQVEALAHESKGLFKNKKIISILAGTPIKRLEKLFQTKHILRLMPNTPTALGAGIVLACCSNEFSVIDLEEMEKRFLKCGEFINLGTEKELDELTVFAGSGPAYIFFLAKTYQDELIKLGYSDALARKIIDQLFVGSSLLIQQEKEFSYQQQIDKVTSKAGVTIEAINVLKDSSMNTIIHNSLEAALKRTNELRDLSIES